VLVYFCSRAIWDSQLFYPTTPLARPLFLTGVNINHAATLKAYQSGQFEFPMMIYHQLLHSPRCTDNIEEADLYFVPAFREHPSIKCANMNEVVEEIEAQHPQLPAAWDMLGPRHILVDARAAEHCAYAVPHETRKYHFKPWLLEVANGIPWNRAWYFDGVSASHDRLIRLERPYQFPYPTMFHGRAVDNPAIKTAASSVGPKEYLWSYFGSMHFREIRRLAEIECSLSPRCFYIGTVLVFEQCFALQDAIRSTVWWLHLLA
jgi:hypothetical protein